MQIINSIGDLSLVRLFSILQLSLAATIFTSWAQTRLKNPFHLFLLIIIIFTLPPFQVMVSYAAYCFLPLTIILSMLAAIHISNTQINLKPKKYFLNHNFMFAQIFLITSYATYQSTTSFYAATAVLILLYSKNLNFQTIRKKSLLFLLNGCLATLLYAVPIKLLGLLGIVPPEANHNPNAIVSDIPARLKWFVQEPLLNSANLWNIFPKTSYGVMAFRLYDSHNHTHFHTRNKKKS